MIYVDNHIQHPQEFTKARHLANVAKYLVHKILITPRLVPGGTLFTERTDVLPHDSAQSREKWD